jgi:enoyl-CoA hydratase
MTAQPEQFIRLDVTGPLAEVVLNNPGRLNAMGRSFFHQIRDVFLQLDRDPAIRCILVWAEGRVFSAGLNLKDTEGLMPSRETARSDASRNWKLRETIMDFQDCFQTLRRCSKPVIAAVSGLCIGGGLDLATACDIRICTEESSFSIHEVKMAMVADLGTLQRITSIVGKGFAREMAFTGRLVNARRALDFGLVTEVLPDKPALLQSARAMAAAIVKNSPFAVQGVKRVLDYCDEHSEAEGLEYVAQWNTAFFLSADLTEALQAFAEKRDPRFTGE